MATLTLDTPELAGRYEDLSDKQYEHGKLLVRSLEIAPGSRVLDIGCGTGRLTEYVAGLVGDSGYVVGIDPLPLRIDIARRRSTSHLVFRVGQCEHLDDFPDHSFDVAYLNSVFHWLAEKLPALTAVHRVLKPGGRLGITSASKERPHQFETIVQAVLRQRPYQRAEQSATTPYKVTSEELAALLERAGFRVRSMEIRTFTDHFDSPRTVIEFSAASSFGNFLSDLPPDLRASAILEIQAELERHRRSQGIVLTRNLIFAVAERI